MSSVRNKRVKLRGEVWGMRYVIWWNQRVKLRGEVWGMRYVIWRN